MIIIYIVKKRRHSRKAITDYDDRQAGKMGYSRESKAETHEKIVESAARRLREEGLDGIGIADLMKEAGLTVGGFYKHFDTRDDLVAEALDAMGSSVWEAAVTGPDGGERRGDALFDSLIDAYLDVRHRDEPGDGCLFAALSADLGRSGKKVRGAATRKLEMALRLLGELFGERRPAARAKAIFLYSALIGAMSLARATSDEKLSAEILTTVGKLLKKTLRPGSSGG
jgi:TetR/AcrR family transcriptional regulator, transcriptional repressor for nem operon